MSTLFRNAEKVKSGLLYVNHLQSNNPLALSPPEGLRILQSRSALFIKTYKDFFVLIKKAKSFFNVTNEVAESTDAIQMLKSFDSDFFGYISSVSLEFDVNSEIITNTYLPLLNLPTSEIDVSYNKKKAVNKNSFLAPFDFIFTSEYSLKAKDPAKNLCANYFAPVPQALSKYQERSDIVPLSVEVQDLYEKVHFTAGEYFLIANFASNVMAEGLDPENFNNVKFLNSVFGKSAPEKKIATQHGVQLWIEIYEN